MERAIFNSIVLALTLATLPRLPSALAAAPARNAGKQASQQTSQQQPASRPATHSNATPARPSTVTRDVCDQHPNLKQCS